MAKNFLTPLGLVRLASDPATGSEGQLYFNTTSDIVRVYKNNAWENLTPTTEEIQDAVAPLLFHDNHTNLSVEYNDENNQLILTAASASLSASAGYYGSFYDTTTQYATVANTAYTVEINTTVEQNGVQIENNINGRPTRLKFLHTGVYNIQFSAQLYKPTSNAADVYVWIALNGTNVPHSAGTTGLTGNNSKIVVAWNYVMTMNANDFLEFKWSSSDNGVQMLTNTSATPSPQIPSIIVTAQQVAAVLPGNGSGSSNYLNDLLDVSIINPENHQLVAFNYETGLWKNLHPSEINLATITNLNNAIVTASAAAVNYLVNGAPGALDTLDELAAALGDDQNFATTVTNSLASKLNSSTASATYLTQANASATYLTQASGLTIQSASAIYLTQDLGLSKANASATYLTKANASSTYLTQADALTTYLTQASAAYVIEDIENNIDSIYDILFEGGAAYLEDSGGTVYGDVTIDGNLSVSGSVDFLSPYLTVANASQTYLTQAAGLTAATASATYLTQTAGLTKASASATYLTQPAASALFVHNNHTNLTATYANNQILLNAEGGGSSSVIYSAEQPDVSQLQPGALWMDSNSVASTGGSSGTGLYYWSEDASGNLIPDSAGTQNIGSPTYPVKHIYASSSSIYLGNVQLTSNGSTLLVGGNQLVTSSTASSSYIPKSDQQSIINSASAAAVNYLVSGAPGALDTLDELAAALNDNANIVDTLLTKTSASTTYAPKNSPTFTGTVTLPTGTVTSNMIANGTIVAEDINSSAGITWNQLSVSETIDVNEILSLNGVTSNIQTQLDGKASTAPLTLSQSTNNANYPLTITSANQQNGGAGWSDILKITNSKSGATNPNKFIRISDAGDLEILNSAYSAVNFSITDVGDIAIRNNISVGGTVTPSAYTPGQVIKTTIWNATDMGFTSNFTNNTTNMNTIASKSYTPAYISSKIFFEVYARYEITGAAGDSFYSQLTWAGNEIGLQREIFTNGAGGGSRSSKLFPLVGQVINGSLTAYTFAVKARLDSSDDTLSVPALDNAFFVKITEVAR